ncbi:MAG: trigger factor [Synechococcus sp. SB0678_bin_12]|nr:trigger factor [Synechococcus sp. SB0678_bin_12]MYI87017.1 trigger factor [Synechococcus sp. SB0672_bin_10]
MGPIRGICGCSEASLSPCRASPMAWLSRIGHLRCCAFPAMASDLQVKTSPRPQSRLALEVVVPAERCQRSYDKAMRKLCRTVRLPGFRPGRVPQTAVLQQLGARQVWITALEQLLEDTAQDVLNDEDLALLGKLQLQDSFDALAQQFNPGESLTLNMEADVRPSPALKAYRDLEVEVEETSSEGMLADELEQRRRSASTTVPLERTTAEMGDVAVIKLVPPPDGLDEEESPGPREREMEVELDEEDKTMSRVVSLIVGMTVGETRTLPSETNGDDANEGGSETENNGPARQDLDQDDETNRVSITLCGLKARQLPELDDAFAQKVSRFSTMAELEEALGREIDRQVQENNKENRQDALLDMLCEEMEVELPQSMVEKEMEVVMEDFKDKLRARGVNPDFRLSDKLLEQLEPVKLEEARRRLQRNLALETVARAEQLTVAETELEDQIQALRKRLKARQASKLDPTKLRIFVKTGLLREKALAWLEEHNSFKVRTAMAENGEEAQSSPALTSKPTESIHEQI